MLEHITVQQLPESLSAEKYKSHFCDVTTASSIANITAIPVQPLPTAHFVDDLSQCYVQLPYQTTTPEGTGNLGGPIRRNIEGLLSKAAEKFVSQISDHLRDDLEGESSDEAKPSAVACTACMSIAQRVAPLVSSSPNLKWGALTANTGGVSLVLQSLVTDRRLDFDIDPDGAAISVSRIDEHMHLDSCEIPVSNTRMLRELAGWVISRS